MFKRNAIISGKPVPMTMRSIKMTINGTCQNSTRTNCFTPIWYGVVQGGFNHFTGTWPVGKWCFGCLRLEPNTLKSSLILIKWSRIMHGRNHKDRQSKSNTSCLYSIASFIHIAYLRNNYMFWPSFLGHHQDDHISYSRQLCLFVCCLFSWCYNPLWLYLPQPGSGL
jgi:hypothetical protein